MSVEKTEEVRARVKLGGGGGGTLDKLVKGRGGGAGPPGSKGGGGGIDPPDGIGGGGGGGEELVNGKGGGGGGNEFTEGGLGTRDGRGGGGGMEFVHGRGGGGGGGGMVFADEVRGKETEETLGGRGGGRGIDMVDEMGGRGTIGDPSNGVEVVELLNGTAEEEFAELNGGNRSNRSLELRVSGGMLLVVEESDRFKIEKLSSHEEIFLLVFSWQLQQHETVVEDVFKLGLEST